MTEYVTTVEQARTEAQLQRERLAQEAREAEAALERQAEEARARIAEEARKAQEQAASEAASAKARAQAEALAQQASIRKAQGEAERQAEAAKAQAREARRIELRKQDLPFTRPQRAITDIGGYIASVEAARTSAHREGRTAREGIEKAKEDYFAEVDQWHSKTVADIESQKLGAMEDIAKQLADAQAEIQRQVALLYSDIDEWERNAVSALEKAAKDYEAALAQMDVTGPEAFAQLQKEGKIPSNAVLVNYDKETGIVEWMIPETPQDMFARLKADGTIQADARFESYDPVTNTLTYTLPDNRTGEEIFKDYQKEGKIPASAYYLGYDKTTGQIEYSLTPTTYEDWLTLYFKQPKNIQQSYIFRLAPYLGMREWWQLSDKEKRQVIKEFSEEFSYLTMVLSMTKEEQMAEIKRIGLSTIPVYGTVKYWNEMTPAMKAVSVAMDALFIASLAYGLAKSGIVPKTLEKLKTGLKTIHLEERGSIGRVLTKTITAQDVGMSDAEFERFVRARVYNPSLTPETFRFLESLGQKVTKVVPTVAPSPDVARAFYRGTLPSYAEIIAAGLPKPGEWKPIKRVWQSNMSVISTPVTYNQAVSLANMDPSQWQKLFGTVLSRSLPKGVQPEVIASTMLGFVIDTANVTAAVKYAEALASGKTAKQASQLAEKAAKQTIRQGVSELTKTKALASTQTTTQGMTKTNTLTKTQLAQLTSLTTKPITETRLKAVMRSLTATSIRTKTKTGKRLKKPTQPATPKKKKLKARGEEYPPGTITWLQGQTKRGQEWKIIPPPYTLRKPISSTTPPKGVRVTKGTPQETLTFIGGKLPFKNVAFDLGIVDGFVDVKAKRIEFAGRGLKTDVGKRIPSKTIGVTLADRSMFYRQRATRSKAQRSNRSYSRVVL